MYHTHKGKFVARGIFFGIVFVGLFSLLVFLLWNWLIPSIFGLPAINYFQAVGLLILAKILFFGFHGRSSHNHCYKPREYWKKRFEEEDTSGTENLSRENI
jgi:hypothetical protein